MKKIFILSILIVLPLIVFGETIEVGNPIKGNTFEAIIGRLIDFLFSIAIIVAPLMIVLGGYLFLTSGGDANKVTQGRRLMVWAAIGLGTILLAKAFVSMLEAILGT